MEKLVLDEINELFIEKANKEYKYKKQRLEHYNNREDNRVYNKKSSLRNNVQSLEISEINKKK